MKILWNKNLFTNMFQNIGMGIKKKLEFMLTLYYKHIEFTYSSYPSCID